MYEQEECIFCFESISLTKDKYEIVFNENDIISSENCINTILNDKLKLQCNHVFHTGCFIKYIMIKYQTWKISKQVDDIFYVSCPFCRILVKNQELINIIQIFDEMKLLGNYIRNKLVKLKFKLAFLKFSFYSKKFLKFTVGFPDAYQYIKLTETYEDWEVLDTRIKIIIKDMECLYKQLLKNRNCDFLSYDDRDEIF